MACFDSFDAALAGIEATQPALVLVYQTSGVSRSDMWALRSAAGQAPIMSWGEGLTGEFAFQTMQLGVRGIMASTTSRDRTHLRVLG